MTLIISIIIGYLLAHIYERIGIKISNNKPLVISGWRLHHSLYGILFFALFILFQNIILLGIAIGIIVQHTLTDGFRFLSKE